MQTRILWEAIDSRAWLQHRECVVGVMFLLGVRAPQDKVPFQVDKVPKAHGLQQAVKDGFGPAALVQCTTLATVLRDRVRMLEGRWATGEAKPRAPAWDPASCGNKMQIESG